MKYTIVVDKQPRSNPSSEKREYSIDIEELRAKGEIHDSLIIKLGQVHVVRRLSLSKYHVLSVLKEPIKEPLPDLNIKLFDGDNYIYLVDMTGNIFYAQYLNKNQFNDVFATRTEMNGAIEVSSREIELSVDKKFTNYSTTEEMHAAINMKASEINVELEKKVDEETITGAYLILKINGDTSEAKLNADKIELTANDILNLMAGNAINLTGKNITIASTNFNVDKNGNMICNNANITGKVTATSGKIAGFTVNNNTLKGQQVGLCGLDGEEWAFWAGSDKGSNAPFRVGHNGQVYLADVAINGGSINVISDVGYSAINALGSDNSIASIMSRYIYISEPSTNYLPAQIDMHIYEEDNGDPVIDLIARNITKTTSIKASGITTPVVTQTSLKSKKKNIKKLRINASELINSSDICLYNLKGEKAKSKKHIGLVIGEGYNCPNEVISENGQGVEQYSMISLAWKAIQEQQQIIENLTKRIEQLEAK